MNFSEALKHIDKCRRGWEALKTQFTGGERKLLEDSYLVIAYPRGQLLPAEFTPEFVAEKHRDLFGSSPPNIDFLKILNRRRAILGEIESLKKDLYWINSQIGRRNISLLEVNDFNVEVRFNNLDFDLIQKLKESEFSDKEKTDMSKASIRVVLKSIQD